MIVTSLAMLSIGVALGYIVNQRLARKKLESLRLSH
jgi:hypothetical protein